MQIHVVYQGQSLYLIAQAYNTTVDEITAANEISPEDTLVVGQALVIPIAGSYYWVQPGDSLYSIAQKTGTTVQQLAEINRLSSNGFLPVGLRLHIPPMPKSETETNAYIEPLGGTVTPNIEAAARQASPMLTYLAPFSFQIQRDGSLKSPPLDNFAAIANQRGAVLMMVITNLEEGRFSDELGSLILNTPQLQDTLLDNIITIAKQEGFIDIHFDLEYLEPADRQAYNDFLRKAAALLHQNGLLISTALAPKTSSTQTGAWYTAHDYRAHGEIVDFVVIMTYEWGYSGGPPMPVSPINEVRKVLNYAITEIPADKIMMGQNLYGYDWTLPFVQGGPYARALSPQQAITLAREKNARILYDYTAQAPHFDYWDNNVQHKVWFEDARSIQAKFNLLKELNLRGISYWKLGLSFPQNWLLLRDNFDIIKRL